MLIEITKDLDQLAFAEVLEKESGTDVKKCYQCGKCTAGCPANYLMDISPSQTIRFSQMGMKEKILNSQTIWNCIFCDTCSTRCPQGVDIKGVMDGLRRMAIRQGIRPKSQVRNLEKAFKDNIRGFGRVYEPGVVLDFNIRSGNFLHDVIYFPLMLIKRKISLLPHFKRTAEVNRVLRKAYQISKKAQEAAE